MRQYWVRVQARSRPTGRAVPQTALILLLTRRYSSVLLNFATHSPEDSDTTENSVLRASADRAEWIVPVHIGGSSAYLDLNGRSRTVNTLLIC